ncbi:MAG: hypothetical protein GC149_00890 [Gammaproteobacteria bacterium]|nr:hypothetical protein [Gammaproteobacteria bacterium]
MAVYDLDKLISETRRLAADYRRATGKSLAVSSEIAKHDACVQLQLEPVNEASGGYDALGQAAPWQGLRIQVKGRAIFDEGKGGQRIGQLKLDKEWDAVVLVLMDEAFSPVEMYLAGRHDIVDAMENDTSKRRNRGAMSVAKFKHIAQRVWTADEGRVATALDTRQT